VPELILTDLWTGTSYMAAISASFRRKIQPINKQYPCHCPILSRIMHKSWNIQTRPKVMAHPLQSTLTVAIKFNYNRLSFIVQVFEAELKHGGRLWRKAKIY